MRYRPIALAAFSFFVNCATLDPLADDTCGNGVVENTDGYKEDCDSFPDAQCGKPSDGAAACRLKCSATMACPEGWGCSVGGFCRQPTGTFEKSGEPFSAGITTMIVGDFDGDKRKDILGTSAPIGDTASGGRVHYFGDNAIPQPFVSLPAVLTAPTVYDINGDGRDDIAFGYAYRVFTLAVGGLSVAFGQVDRSFVPTMFPTVTEPNVDAMLVTVAGKSPAGVAGGVNLAFATVEANGNRQNVLISLETDGRTPFAKPLPAGPVDLHGPPLAARIFNETLSPCGEVVAALGNPTPHVYVYSVCRVGAGAKIVWAPEKDPKEILTPEPATGIFLADVDHDGFSDVLIGGADKVYVAKSTGTDFKPIEVMPQLREVPLAAGELDGDGELDYVTPSGVFLTFGPGKGLADGGILDGGAISKYFVIPSPKPWTVATVADLNGDKWPDIVGASVNEPDLDVLANSGKALFMPAFKVASSGAVSQIFVGDLDFDSLPDLGFVQKHTGTDENEVSVAYGRMTFPPEPARVVGRVSGIRQTFVSEFTPGVVGGVGIAMETPGPTATSLPTFSIAVLLPSGERQPLAPLLFDDKNVSKLRPALGNNARDWTPKGLLAGPFVHHDPIPGNEGPRIDLVAISVGALKSLDTGDSQGTPQQGLWFAGSTAPSKFETPHEVLPLDQLRIFNPKTRTVELQGGAGDLDGDGLQEMVSIANDPSGAGAILHILRTSSLATGDTTSPNALLDLPVAGRFVTFAASAGFEDVDGDGNPDFMAILADAAGNLNTEIFLSDGKGRLGVPGITFTPPATTRLDARAFALVTTKGAPSINEPKGKKRELFVLTTNNLFRGTLKTDKSGFDVTDATSVFGGSIKNGLGLVSGDFDGDGVEDLAVADDFAIRIARQNPRVK